MTVRMRSTGFQSKEAREVSKAINRRNEENLAGKAAAEGGSFKVFKPGQ